MFEVEESYDGDVTIEWDVPMPDRPPRIANTAFKPGEFVWSRRLASFRNRPGRRARIMDGIETVRQARNKKTNVMRSLYNHDPYENWTISYALQPNGVYGMWATFEGRYTETEFIEREALRKQRGRENHAMKVAAQAKRAHAIVERRPPRFTMKPPVWREGD